jgi:hypothetical protein
MRLRPSTLAGLCGMGLVATLYAAHALLVARGGGLHPVCLLILVGPGALAAHLSWARGMAHAAIREGARSGLLMAHFAAGLQVSVLALNVLNVDWARYAGQVGSQVAEAVRDAALPATLVAGAAVVAITYAGCVPAGSIGSQLYAVTRRSRETLER